MKKLIPITGLFLIYSASIFAQVGIGTTTPNSMLDVRGSLAASVRSFSATTTAAATDNTLIFTGTSAATLTLPTAVTCAGRIYWIKNASTTSPTPVLTVGTTSTQTIDGNSSWALDEPNEAIRVVSDGANWWVLSQDVAVPKTSTTGGTWVEGGNRVTGTKAIGTLSNFSLPFVTNGIERMRLNTSGYLGVGTTNPSGRFHGVSEASDVGNNYIFEDYGAGTTQGIYMTKARGTAAAPADLSSGDAIGMVRFVPRYNGSLGTSPGSSVEAYYKGTGSDNSTDLRFFTSGSERMRLSETGNVGIGSSSFNATNPEKLLVDAGTTTSFNVISGKGSINNYLQLNIQNRSATANASSDVVATANNGNESINYIDMGINSSAYTNVAAPILGGINTAYFYSTGNDFVIGNGTANKNLIFFTNSFASADEKLRITGTGNVGIGTTTPGDKLTVAGGVSPSADNTYSLGKNGFRWSAVWSANGTIQTSDARLKTNIHPLQYGLKEVMQLRPVSYNWKNDVSLAGPKIGLLAQEVRKLVPEVVVGDEAKENLGMNYAELVPVLINAVKEQQLQIDEVKSRVNTLKNKSHHKK